MWTRFAKGGEPGAGEEWGGWGRVRPGGGAELLHITAKPAMVTDTELQERLKLWREVHQQVS